jgi:hypothetical protein
MLESLGQEPEEVREVLIYAICQTMAQSGMLELVGVSATSGTRTTLMYRNPDTLEVIEIAKPPLSDEDDRAMKENIRRLLASEAG